MKKSDIDIATLGIESLIAHLVPQRYAREEMVDIEVSQAVPKLPASVLLFFGNRLKGTLTKRGQAVEVDPKLTDAPLPPRIREWLEAKQPDLIPVSQFAAQHLYQKQAGVQKESLLAVAAAKVEGKRALALLKLPPEEGVQWSHIEVSGKPTLEITVLGDLTLTENTRVFKAGLFWLVEESVFGLVSDDQQGAPSDISDFFLSAFLGFRRVRQPKVLTRNFKQAVTDFISKEVTDEDDKIAYFNALNVELRSNLPKIDPMEFAQTHFAEEDREALLSLLNERGVPRAAFRKDTELLPRRGREGRLRTEGGLTISGDAAVLKERVESRVLDEKKVIVVHDHVLQVS